MSPRCTRCGLPMYADNGTTIAPLLCGCREDNRTYIEKIEALEKRVKELEDWIASYDLERYEAE